MFTFNGFEVIGNGIMRNQNIFCKVKGIWEILLDEHEDYEF